MTKLWPEFMDAVKWKGPDLYIRELHDHYKKVSIFLPHYLMHQQSYSMDDNPETAAPSSPYHTVMEAIERVRLRSKQEGIRRLSVSPRVIMIIFGASILTLIIYSFRSHSVKG